MAKKSCFFIYLRTFLPYFVPSCTRHVHLLYPPQNNVCFVLLYALNCRGTFWSEKRFYEKKKRRNFIFSSEYFFLSSIRDDEPKSTEKKCVGHTDQGDYFFPAQACTKLPLLLQSVYVCTVSSQLLVVCTVSSGIYIPQRQKPMPMINTSN